MGLTDVIGFVVDSMSPSPSCLVVSFFWLNLDSLCGEESKRCVILISRERYLNF